VVCNLKGCFFVWCSFILGGYQKEDVFNFGRAMKWVRGEIGGGFNYGNMVFFLTQILGPDDPK